MRNKPYVNEDVKLQMEATYTRHSKPKRSFDLVIKGILISSFMLSNFAMGGVSAFATTSPDLPNSPTSVQASQQIQVQEDELVVNLRLAIKAIEDIGWSPKTLQAISNSLHAIDDKLNDDISYRFTFGLKDAILDTKLVIAQYGGDGLTELRGKGNSINETLQSIEAKMGGMSTPSNHATPPPVRKKAEVRITSVAENNVTVVMDGQIQFFSQPAVIIDGSTMVPMRAIFEKLGAEIKWDGETRTVTATKGNTVIKLTLDRDIAYINGSPVKLTAKAQSLNGHTMVSLRFVSEALGASVKWDGSTMTAYIESAGNTDQVSQQVINGIKVKYGRHTYGVSTQSEYDQSLAIVEDALKGFDDVVFGGKYNEYYELFLEGERWSGDRRDRTERNIGLKIAEGSIGELVKAGVSKDVIRTVSKASTVAIDLLQGKTDPLDGTPRSIYDALILNRIDCDAIAETYSAVFDSLGFNTMIIGGSNHAEVLIQINEEWWETASGSFRKVDPKKAIANGSYVISQPTFGTIFE